MEIPVMLGIVRQNGHAIVAPPAIAVIMVMIFIALGYSLGAIEKRMRRFTKIIPEQS
jgi:hypothetical protein